MKIGPLTFTFDDVYFWAIDQDVSIVFLLLIRQHNLSSLSCVAARLHRW